ncbi:MAG: SIS domain-containing protein [Candidatus Krumholzibacteria bacterium]|nr:SIS domain-containing protein [Candidatus Krumholzibacteria bacterium]
MTASDNDRLGGDKMAGAGALFRGAVDDLVATLGRLDETHLAAVAALAADVQQSWSRGGKLLVCGNGGSAADSQHIVAELVGRFLAERPGYAALALTANTSTLTAVGNDYGYDHIFSRQVQAMGGADDVLLVISTSGNSANCLTAVAAARVHGMKVHGFLGRDGGALLPLLDGAMVAPSDSTPKIQEVHITMGHLLCMILERWVTATD